MVFVTLSLPVGSSSLLTGMFSRVDTGKSVGGLNRNTELGSKQRVKKALQRNVSILARSIFLRRDLYGMLFHPESVICIFMGLCRACTLVFSWGG